VKFTPVFAEGEATGNQTTEPAKTDPAGQPQPGGLFGGGGIMTYAPFILLGLFFLVVILPAQRRRKREEAEKMAKMKTGAKVILTSGIVGKIISLKEGEDELVIKSDDTKLRVLRASIASVVDESAPATATTEPAKS
jgi:preprotein translocase subunit YajC